MDGLHNSLMRVANNKIQILSREWFKNQDCGQKKGLMSFGAPFGTAHDIASVTQRSGNAVLELDGLGGLLLPWYRYSY